MPTSRSADFLSAKKQIKEKVVAIDYVKHKDLIEEINKKNLKTAIQFYSNTTPLYLENMILWSSEEETSKILPAVKQSLEMRHKNKIIQRTLLRLITYPLTILTYLFTPALKKLQGLDYELAAYDMVKVHLAKEPLDD